jgi:adenylate cyclase
MSLYHELKRRKVFRVVIAYAVVGWLLAEVGALLFQTFEAPDWVMKVFATVIILGFPLALFFAWAFELTPEGIRRDGAAVEELAEHEVAEKPAASASAPAVSEADAKSIAVLPFVDLSAEGDNEYFSDGLTDELLNELTNVGDLRVSSRTSCFAFKGKDVDIPTVASALNVAYVLEGSVRKAGNRLRITGQLIEAANDTHLWSDTYDRELDDIFAIQDDISQSIVNTLSLTLKRKRGSQQRVDPKAYDFFLRGLGYFAKHDIKDTVYARQMFSRALEVDSRFGRAWAGLAYTYGFDYMYFNATDVNFAEARRTSTKALDLAPNLAESHVSAGIAHCMCQEYAEAEAEFEKAIQLDPKNYEAWYFFGRTKVHEGDLERAIKLLDRASKVRPDDYQSVLLQTQLYISLGKRDRAMEVSSEGMERVRAVLELNPDDNRALNLGAFALLRLGEIEEAKQWMYTSATNAPSDAIIQYNAACFYSVAGEVEKALDCLENCVIKAGNVNREWLEHDSDLDNIRDQPRFKEVIENLPH